MKENLSFNFLTEDEKPIQEKCGIVGLYTNSKLNLTEALSAGSGVQHRGQHGAGLAFKTEQKIITHTDSGLLREVFTPDVVNKLETYNPQNWLLLHCRYGTCGSYAKKNLQPCVAASEYGESIAVVHNGQFTNIDEMRKHLNNETTEDYSDSYIFTQLLAQMPGRSWETKIIKALSLVDGAYSLIVGTPNNSLLVARDSYGIRPLFLGKLENSLIVASETHAFDKVGADLIREVKNGEILRINENGITTLKENRRGAPHFCDFELAYFSHPMSLFSKSEKENEMMSIASFRLNCGRILAEEVKIANASFCVGIPDSGNFIANGYASASGLPYLPLILRDHFDLNGNQRLFMRDDQKETIAKKVLGKLSLVPDKNIWKDAVVIIGDDSIVRGNVSSKITEAVLNLGASEVHWIIGFPPVSHPCHLGVSIRTEEELIASQYNCDQEKIAKAIGAASIYYISPEGFIKARLSENNIIKPQNSKKTYPKEIFLVNGGCGGCITGIYPISKEGIIFEAEKPKKSQQVFYPPQTLSLPQNLHRLV